MITFIRNLSFTQKKEEVKRPVTTSKSFPQPGKNVHIGDGDRPSASVPEEDEILKFLKCEKREITEEKTNGIGVITSIDSSLETGLINEFYGFCQEKFSNQPIKVGANVQFTAVKSFKTSDKWLVRELTILPDAKEKTTHENNKILRSLVGQIAINPTDSSLEVHWGGNERQREFSIVLPKDHPDLIKLKFTFRAGDYVRVELENSQYEDIMKKKNFKAGIKLYTISPNMQKTLVGKITFIEPIEKFFIVDHTIRVSTEGSNFSPKLGNYVKCTVIEARQSTNENCPWRAVEFSKSSIVDCLEYMQKSVNTDEWIDTEDFGDEAEQNDKDDENGIAVRPKQIQLQGVKVGSSQSKRITVKNKSKEELILQSVDLSGDKTIATFSIELAPKYRSTITAKLAPGKYYNFKIKCVVLKPGTATNKIILNFEGFQIIRKIVVNGTYDDAQVIDENDLLPLVLRDSNIGADRKWQKGDEREILEQILLEAFRPPPRPKLPPRETQPHFIAQRIPPAFVPMEIRSTFVTRKKANVFTEHYNFMNAPLSFATYKQQFDMSVWFEELENEKRRREYDITVTMQKSGDYFKFPVQGIRNFQPKLRIADSIRVYDPKNKRGLSYEGHIHEILQSQIVATFEESFSDFYKPKALKVQFLTGRTSYMRYHYAIDQAVKHLGESWLFPVSIPAIKPPRINFTEQTDPLIANLQNMNLNNSSNRDDQKVLTFFNTSLNNEQKTAVRQILKGQARPIPYIIFGPPGTGKTITLVEAIIQVYTLDPTSRILVTTPSNSAADVIAKRLLASGQFSLGEFVRLVGYMRFQEHEEDKTVIPEDIFPYCENGDRLDLIVQNRLIISTCNTAGQFFALGLSTTHFSHVFIDEAGNCTEPEALISCIQVALGKGRQGQVTLVGDPKQLGPVVLNGKVEKFLSLSFLERLMSMDLYKRNEEDFPGEKYNPMVLTKLVKNYRSHPRLLIVPSKLFYDSELEPCADLEETSGLAKKLEFLPVKGTPLLFHGVVSKDEQDQDSPSRYNVEEVKEVCKYVKALLSAGVSASEIGIITPYTKQVEKLRTALPIKLGYCDDELLPRIGSVEEFQGAERNVTIISTVRSIDTTIDVEKAKERLMFIFSAKRFNVQITRAKSLLIIVGNPHALCYDDNWNELINTAKQLGVYTDKSRIPY